MDKATCAVIEREMHAALAPIAAKYGAKVTGGGGKYDHHSFTPKLSFVKVAADGQVMTAEFRALKAYYPNIAGKTFNVRTKGHVTVIGYNSKAHQYPLLVRYPNGKVFKLPLTALDWFQPAFEVVGA